MKNLIFCDLSWGHWFLTLLPWYAYMAFFVAGYLLLLGGRWLFEGRPYNVARSADVGGMFLTLFVCVAARIIQRNNFNATQWMESGIFNWVVVSLSIFVVRYFLRQKLKYTMDFFYAIIIAPLFFYFIITSIPIYWFYGNAVDCLGGIFQLIGWLLCVIYDTRTHRMDQRRWIAEYKPKYKFKN